MPTNFLMLLLQLCGGECGERRHSSPPHRRSAEKKEIHRSKLENKRFVACLNVSRIVLMRGRDRLLLGHEVLHAGAAPRDVRDYRVQLVEQGPASGLHQLR